MNSSHFHTVNARLVELAEELSAGCDTDFDTITDDLEREFAELRCESLAHDWR